MTDDVPDGEAPARRPFASWLTEQRRGALHAELSDGMAELAQRVVETGKKGTMVLTIELASNGVDAVKVGDKIVVKPPSASTPEAFYFVDQHGNLSRSDPRQPALPLGIDELDQRRTGEGT